MQIDKLISILEAARECAELREQLVVHSEDILQYRQRLTVIYGTEKVKTSPRGSYSPVLDAIEQCETNFDNVEEDIKRLSVYVDEAEAYIRYLPRFRDQVLLRCRYCENWPISKIARVRKRTPSAIKKCIGRLIADLAKRIP